MIVELIRNLDDAPAPPAAPLNKLDLIRLGSTIKLRRRSLSSRFAAAKVGKLSLCVATFRVPGAFERAFCSHSRPSACIPRPA